MTLCPLKMPSTMKNSQNQYQNHFCCISFSFFFFLLFIFRRCSVRSGRRRRLLSGRRRRRVHPRTEIGVGCVKSRRLTGRWRRIRLGRSRRNRRVGRGCNNGISGEGKRMPWRDGVRGNTDGSNTWYHAYVRR